jgi:nucleotide-binding universal stress UspA family protein
MLGDVLIPLRTQPVPETKETVATLLRLASSFAIHATLSPLEVAVPHLQHRWSGAFMGLVGMGAEIERASQEASRNLIASVDKRPGLQVVGHPLRVGFGEAPVSITSAARYHDLTMIAFTDVESAAAMAEAAIFGTGRPAMLIPATWSDAARPFAKIAVARDGSGTASRALHDAMPLLTNADEVVVINAPADKPIDAGGLADLSDCLVRQGIAPRFVETDIEVQDIGLALQHCARTEGAGLLVMGAYGHSRLQQFILGGATRGVLANLQLPVLMSHS